MPTKKSSQSWKTNSQTTGREPGSNQTSNQQNQQKTEEPKYVGEKMINTSEGRMSIPITEAHRSVEKDSRWTNAFGKDAAYARAAGAELINVDGRNVFIFRSTPFVTGSQEVMGFTPVRPGSRELRQVFVNKELNKFTTDERGEGAVYNGENVLSESWGPQVMRSKGFTAAKANAGEMIVSYQDGKFVGTMGTKEQEERYGRTYTDVKSGELEKTAGGYVQGETPISGQPTDKKQPSTQGKQTPTGTQQSKTPTMKKKTGNR